MNNMDNTSIPFVYKINVLEALKEKGYSSYRIRQEKIFSQKTLTMFRNNKMTSWSSIGLLCELLECDIGDIVKYEKK